MKLRGLVYLIPTPLNRDETVDVLSARRLVRRAIDTGAHALWVLGSAGEQPLLTDRERRVMLEAAVAEAGGTVPVIAGAMDCSTRRALQNIRVLREAGADYATLMPPYYLPLRQSEVVAFYTALAEEGDLPLVLYNESTVSGVNMAPETIAQLAVLPNVVAIKESSADLRHFQQTLYAVSGDPHFAVLAGSDQLAHASLLAGGHGVICGFSSIAPELYVGIHRAVQQGNLESGRAYQRQLVTLARLIYGSGASVAVTKYALSLLGLCSPYVCAPFGPPPAEVAQRLPALLQRLSVVGDQLATATAGIAR